MSVSSANKGKKIAVSAGIIVVIGLIHIFRVGSYLPDPWNTYYYSYFSDIAIPFAMYFLLSLSHDQIHFLGDWRVKAGIVFGGACLLEALQGFGVPLFGRTFDPLDFPMFAAGVLLAILLDRALFNQSGRKEN